MGKFYYSDNRLFYANEQTVKTELDEKQAFVLFTENFKELRLHCKLSLMALSDVLDIPNQTLSSYENKTHVPSMVQALKICAYFGLTIEEFILCGLDEYPYDIVELYERKKKGLF